jgi:dynamin 1-like protein
LLHHIRTTLPDIKQKISSGLAKYTLELGQLGDPVDESANLVSASEMKYWVAYRIG